MPKLPISMVVNLGGTALGEYTPGQGIISLSKKAFIHRKGEDRRRAMRETLSHELMHWVHMDSQGKKAEAYRAAIKSHFATRTAGYPKTPYNGGFLHQDKWWREYAGRSYPFDKKSPLGVEVPTCYFQLWENQPMLLELSNRAQSPDADAFRETFALVNSIFD